MGRRARANLMTSMLALTNTISRSAGSKNFGWKRPPCGLGGFAGSIRCESGQIARALAGHSYELQQSRADDLAEPESAPLSNPEMDALTDHLFLPEKEELDKL